MNRRQFLNALAGVGAAASLPSGLIVPEPVYPLPMQWGAIEGGAVGLVSTQGVVVAAKTFDSVWVDDGLAHFETEWSYGEILFPEGSALTIDRVAIRTPGIDRTIVRTLGNGRLVLLGSDDVAVSGVLS